MTTRLKRDVAETASAHKLMTTLFRYGAPVAEWAEFRAGAMKLGASGPVLDAMLRTGMLVSGHGRIWWNGL